MCHVSLLEGQLTAQGAELRAHRAECARLKAAGKLSATPRHFECPIECDVMHDPVSAADGHTYERSAIERWIRTSGVSPSTGAPTTE